MRRFRLRIVLPFPISANRYWRTRAIVSRHKPAFASTYVSAEATAYKNSVKVLCIESGIRPADGPLAVSLWLFRPQKSGDLDNRIKVLLDALQGVAYKDDDQIVELHAYRLDDKARPRVEVAIDPATNQGKLL